MCLNISTIKVKNKPDKDGFLLGYKVIRKDNRAAFSSINNIYIVGGNISSRTDVKLYADEKRNREVNLGFHLLLTRADARSMKANIKDGRYALYRQIPIKIIKVYYKPEDVVSYGVFSGLRSVVVTKLTVKSLEGIK